MAWPQAFGLAWSVMELVRLFGESFKVSRWSRSRRRKRDHRIGLAWLQLLRKMISEKEGNLMKRGIILIALLMGWLIACGSEPPPTATPVPPSTSQPPTSTPQPTFTPAPTEAPTPAPTHTPAPIDNALANGDWVFFGADCPDRYINCTPESSDIDIISLDAQEYKPVADDSPSIVIMCVPDYPAFAFRSNLPLDNDNIAVTLNGTLFWSNDISERDWVWFEHSNNIVRLIQDAEHAQELVHISIGNTPEEIITTSTFNPVGFIENYNRLPCVN